MSRIKIILICTVSLFILAARAERSVVTVDAKAGKPISQPHNFGFSETSNFKTFTSLGHCNEGVMTATNFQPPKHGAVIQLTKDEAQRLADRWGLKSY